MKLGHLNAVVAVAKFGSLRAASRQLGMAQPAITRSIREIEKEVGVPLFERHSKGTRPTHMGEAMVRHGQAIQAQLRCAYEEIEQLKGLSIGQVTATFSSASIIAIVPKVLSSFRKRYPDGLLKISEGLFQAAEGQIQEGAVDFYVGPFDAAVSATRLMIERLFDNRRYVICRKGHSLRKSKRLSDLSSAEWIRPTISAHTSEVDFEAWFVSRGLKRPKIVMHTQSALVTLAAVANSDLLTLLPRQWLEYVPMQGQIEAIPLSEDCPQSMPICIARRRDLPLTPMAEYFCDLVRRVGQNYARSTP